MVVTYYVYELKKKDIQFDTDFNLESDSKIYCTEFVYKIFNRNTSYTVIHANKKFTGKTYVSISDVYDNSSCKVVERSH